MEDITFDLIDIKQETTTNGQDEGQIQVRFSPARTARHLPAAPENYFSVPISLGRAGLSELLNHILELKPTKAFEFLINNKFLRVTLDKYLSTHNLSLEDELDIEYLEATPPPDRDQSTPHPDWVSSIDSCLGVSTLYLPDQIAPTSKQPKPDLTFSPQDAILSVVGCYDHLVRIWAHSMQPANQKFEKSTQSLIAQGAGHLGPVTSVRVARPFQKSAANSAALIVSGSHDKTARLWELQPQQVESNSPKLSTVPKASKLSCLGIFDYHVGSITAIETRFHPNRPGSLNQGVRTTTSNRDAIQFLSAGYDGAIALWTNGPEYRIEQSIVEEQHALTNKGMGRKLKAQKQHVHQAQAKVTTLDEELTLPHYKPMTAYMGHRGAVSSVIWPHQGSFYSGGYDATIKLWDLERSKYVHAWSGGHVVNCLDFSSQLNLIASGDQDGMVRLWDPRINNKNGDVDSDDDEEAQNATRLPMTKTNKGQFKACDSWVSSVKFMPSIASAPYYMMTTGYDGKAKLWDIRSSKPLHMMDTNSERLLCGDIVPSASATQPGTFHADIYSVCGGTGKQVDRLHWTLQTSD